MKSPELTLLLSSLFDDVKRLHPGVKGLDRDYHTIEMRVEHEGFSFLSKTLPILADAFHEGLEKKRFLCPSNFSKARGSSIPKLLSGLMQDVFDKRTGDLLEVPSIEAILSIRQICLYFKKVADSTKDIDHMTKAAFSDFFSCESDVKDELPCDLDSMIKRISNYILPHLSNEMKSFSPKHGPGAVVEGVKGNRKWRLLTKFLFNGFLDKFGWGDLFVSERWNDLLSPLDHTSQLAFPFIGDHCLRGTAKLCAVPKSSTSLRTITIEPMLNQFIQQGLNTALRDSISKCRILSRCLALSDQTENNYLAKIGSQYGTFSTIDLKSASDLLSVRVVRSVFSRHQEFLDELLNCRTDTVDVKNPRYIRKYAGMGNATTFPVQSICFTVIGIASILMATRSTCSYKNVVAASSHLRVYGDDIIVSSQYARQVVQGLHDAGLKVNVKKSFFDGNFKESCGTDWYSGVEVTPVYLKYHPRKISQETRALANYAAASNRMYLRCFYSSAEALQSIVEQVTGKLPLVRKCEWSTIYDSTITNGASPGLGWITRQGHFEYQRWDSNLHRWLVKTSVLTSVKTDDILGGYAALLKFFLTPLLGRSNDHLKSSPVRYRTRLRSRWVPA